MASDDYTIKGVFKRKILKPAGVFALSALLYWIFFWQGTVNFSPDDWDVFRAGLIFPGLLAAYAFLRS